MTNDEYIILLKEVLASNDVDQLENAFNALQPFEITELSTKQLTEYLPYAAKALDLLINKNPAQENRVEF